MPDLYRKHALTCTSYKKRKINWLYTDVSKRTLAVLYSLLHVFVNTFDCSSSYYEQPTITKKFLVWYTEE